LLRKQQKTLGVYFFAAPCRMFQAQATAIGNTQSLMLEHYVFTTTG